MIKYMADWIYPVSSEPIANGYIILDDNGKILELGRVEDSSAGDFIKLDGAIIPGFVNAHCHLELSHMLGKVDTGTGLLDFIKNVVRRRGDSSPAEIQEACHNADKYMWENGIMAVGDISNVRDTFEVKHNSPIKYYTFVEAFDFLDEQKTGEVWETAMDVYNVAPADNGHRKSIVPHAPYTVSPALFKNINNYAGNGATLSIHNQEIIDENRLFIDKSGRFPEFYKGFGSDLSFFHPTGSTSIHYTMDHLVHEGNLLMVHNTFTGREDMRAAHRYNPDIYWVSCPNANLYIENALPRYSEFLAENARICLGTDSLTSNWQLSILEEMKTISQYQSYVPFEVLLLWGTLNGAKALGFDKQLGSLEPGKTPGILELHNMQNHQLTAASYVKRLF